MLRCFSCGELSFSLICPLCRGHLLSPSLIKRELVRFPVFSFYKYSEIEKFLYSKHTLVGSGIFKILANESFSKFAYNFQYDSVSTVLPIDDHTDNGYSHTAILARALSSKFLDVKFGALRAKNRIKYAGQTLEFRRSNPREFDYRLNFEQVVLVDDIITTGTTILEASEAIKSGGGEVLMALTLADASE